MNVMKEICKLIDKHGEQKATLLLLMSLVSMLKQQIKDKK